MLGFHLISFWKPMQKERENISIEMPLKFFEEARYKWLYNNLSNSMYIKCPKNAYLLEQSTPIVT